MRTFVKGRGGAGPEYFRAEAAGLRWLAEAGEVPVVEVVEEHSDGLVLQRIESASPTERAAAEFGRRLAKLHRSGAEAYGAAPPGAPASGYIADLDMPYGEYETFGRMYAHLRIQPYLKTFDAKQREIFEAICKKLNEEDQALIGPPEAPSRLHGDLWSGNLMWANDGQVWLIDPAAHGGHRETDLAMLQLFGAPQLATILDAYQAEHPLAEGWKQRVALHQIWPLLVHAELFGGGYAQEAAQAARTMMRSAGTKKQAHKQDRKENNHQRRESGSH